MVQNTIVSEKQLPSRKWKEAKNEVIIKSVLTRFMVPFQAQNHVSGIPNIINQKWIPENMLLYVVITSSVITCFWKFLSFKDTSW